MIVFGLVAGGLIVSGAARAFAATCQSTPTPNVGSFGTGLSEVSATSSRNAWAVGGIVDNDGANRTLIEHWSGRAWKVHASPNPRGAELSVLSGVAATSSINAWAVGEFNDGLTSRNLIEHWNGKAWKIQASPKLARSDLFAVAATSSTNAWAVGNDSNGAMIEHWNGKAWKLQVSPKLAASWLSDVAATSARNVWAVGSDGEDTLIEHWNGNAWKIQASPTPRFFQNQFGQLSGVAATSSTNAWAVGSAAVSLGMPSPLYAPTHTLIEHWNGRNWTNQASPNPGDSRFGSQLFDVAATSSTNAWAVGLTLHNGPTDRTLIEQWNGSA